MIDHRSPAWPHGPPTTPARCEEPSVGDTVTISRDEYIKLRHAADVLDGLAAMIRRVLPGSH